MSLDRKILLGIATIGLAAGLTGCSKSNYSRLDLDGDGIEDSISVARSTSPQGAPLAQLETKIVFGKKVKVPRTGFMSHMPLVDDYTTERGLCEPIYFLTPTQPRIEPGLTDKTTPKLADRKYLEADPREVGIEPTLRLQEGVDMPEIYLEVKGKGTDGKEIDRRYTIHNVNFKRLATYAAKLRPSPDRNVEAYETGIPTKYVINLAR